MVMSARVQLVKRERKKSFYVRELSAILARLVQDQPTLMQLYFTRVDLSANGSYCYVFCAFLNAASVAEGNQMFEEARKILVLYKGSMRKALATALSSRYVPDLRFFYDETKEKEQRVTDLLTKVSEELDQYDGRTVPMPDGEDDE